MPDQLRAVECPSEVIDQISGWLTDIVGDWYGDGYPEAILQQWLMKVLLLY